MKNKTKIIIIICYILLSSISSGFAINEEAPQIYGKTLNNTNFILSKNNGKLRLINFFTTNCKYCKKELPELAVMEKEMPEVLFIAVCVGNLNKTKVKKFINALPKAPKLIVCAGEQVKKDYGIIGYPYSVIIDKKGHIINTIPGYNTKIIKTLLKKLVKP